MSTKFSIAWWEKEIRRFLKRNDAVGRNAINMALASVEQKFGVAERNRLIEELKLRGEGFNTK